MGKILLSICIPTYNRENVVVGSVKRYLEYRDEGIEIVVCDNGSKDNTFDKLKSINDERLRVFRNKTNKGFTYNLLRVVKEARGQFICMMSDEDNIFPEALEELLRSIRYAFKEKLDIAGFVCDYSNPNAIKCREDQLLAVLYGRVSYMSGLIINREKMIDEDFVQTKTIYPHIELLLRLATRGTIVFSDMSLIYKFKEAETGVVAEENEQGQRVSLPYVYPQERLKQLSHDLDMVKRLDENYDTKIKLFNKIFKTKIIQGTIIFELIKFNQEMKTYHQIKEETIDLLEEFKELYMQEVTEYFPRKYYSVARRYMTEISKVILQVRKIRRDYRDLLNQGWESIIVGDEDYVQDTVHSLLKYGYKFDYIIKEEENTPIHNGISWSEVEHKERVILIVQDIEEYLQLATQCNVENKMIMLVEWLKLTT